MGSSARHVPSRGVASWVLRAGARETRRTDRIGEERREEKSRRQRGRGGRGESRSMAPQWTGLDPELEAIFNDDEPDGPDLPRKKVPAGDVYEASRAGDVERLRWLLELGVNVNARDAWDSVALYYACLAGHLDAAHMLLENGAICSENTFDGHRCHYAALNLRVRKLLKAYEARPRPLSPLPASLRELFMSSYSNLIYLECSFGNPREDSSAPCTGLHDSHRAPASGEYLESNEAPDVTFYVSGRAVQAHRAILAARSPYFKKKFETDWRHRSEFRFPSSKLSYSALFSLLHFFYTDRLDVAVDDMEDLVRICKVCKCLALQKSLEKEINHQRFASYKSLRSADDSQKRFILQGSSLPWQEQLHAALRRLFRLTLVNSTKECREREQGLDGRISKTRDSADRVADNRKEQSPMADTLEEEVWADNEQNRDRMEASSEACSISLQEEELNKDHADVLFLVAGERFRCHRAILATRSEYFKARFFRALESELERPGRVTHEHNIGILPVLEEHDLSAGAFKKLLEYIYTDTVEDIDPDEAEEIFDAASRYLLFPLKRAVVDVLLPHLETTPPAELCHWLLLSDMYGVAKLREHCLDAMALNFELFAATPEFRQMLKSLPPPSGDDTARTSAPSAPGEAGRDNVGNLLDDLREKWLAIEGDELDQRDESAREFDQRLEKLVEMATLEESEMDYDQDSSGDLDPEE